MNENSKKKKRSLSSAELRQKVIYYQSEAAKYKFLSDKYEMLLSQALQSTPISEEATTEVKVALENEERVECTSYFNYSFIQEKDEPPFIYGSFVIKNSGTTTLNIPIICLKTNEADDVTIGGKIGEVDNSGDKLMGSFETWTYVHHDWRKKWIEDGELWLRPKDTSYIDPGEKLSFSGFDINFKNSNSLKPITIDGFCYFEQLTAGAKSLNSISITV